MGSKGEATKSKIIEAARKLLRLKGYAGTGIEEICKESGVTRGNLYFHFKSKEEIACAAVDDAAGRYIPFFETLMQDEDDPLRKIELMMDGVFAFHESRGSKASCLFGNIAQEAGETGRTLAQASQRFFEAWIDLIAGLFDEAKGKGLVHGHLDSEALGHLIVGSFEGSLILFKASQDPAVYAKTRKALKGVLAGLRVK
ncbi:MAG: TetR/AcrR family transcriptional regulator [Pseudomonadota bacterium]